MGCGKGWRNPGVVEHSRVDVPVEGMEGKRYSGTGLKTLGNIVRKERKKKKVNEELEREGGSGDFQSHP